MSRTQHSRNQGRTNHCPQLPAGGTSATKPGAWTHKRFPQPVTANDLERSPKPGPQNFLKAGFFHPNKSRSSCMNGLALSDCTSALFLSLQGQQLHRGDFFEQQMLVLGFWNGILWHSVPEDYQQLGVRCPSSRGQKPPREPSFLDYCSQLIP